MRIPDFEMERMQSTWENLVQFDMSESGVRPVTLRELVDMGFDLESALDMPLGYSQSNGTIPLRERLAALYPGASVDHIEVTNGTSEANYLVALSALGPGDEIAVELPNYMQLWGVPHSLQAPIRAFHLRADRGWEPDWEDFERAVTPKTRLLYLSNPNNPSGAILSEPAMRRIVARCEQTNTLLLADEVYLGAELQGPRTRSFWGMSDKVVVTSGLSKAYGIPGVRIGWIVGPPAFVATCWAQHDYLTIGPNKLSDLVARTAVTEANRERLYARTRAILAANLPALEAWADGFGGRLTLNRPRAGAMALVRYRGEVSSLALCERIRTTQSTLIVPGIHVGLEGHLRVWYGGRPEFVAEGLRRIGLVLDEVLR
jgi:hypothetical protein